MEGDIVSVSEQLPAFGEFIDEETSTRLQLMDGVDDLRRALDRELERISEVTSGDERALAAARAATDKTYASAMEFLRQRMQEAGL